MVVLTSSVGDERRMRHGHVGEDITWGPAGSSLLERLENRQRSIEVCTAPDPTREHLQRRQAEGADLRVCKPQLRAVAHVRLFERATRQVAGANELDVVAESLEEPWDPRLRDQVPQRATFVAGSLCLGKFIEITDVEHGRERQLRLHVVGTARRCDLEPQRAKPVERFPKRKAVVPLDFVGSSHAVEDQIVDIRPPCGLGSRKTQRRRQMFHGAPHRRHVGRRPEIHAVDEPGREQDQDDGHRCAHNVQHDGRLGGSTPGDPAADETGEQVAPRQRRFIRHCHAHGVVRRGKQSHREHRQP